MNGKEAYDKIFDKLTYDQQQELGEEVFRIVYQDLDRLENLEKENQVLREKVNHFKNVKNRYRRNEKFVEKENIKLKKAIKILKRFDFDIYTGACLGFVDSCIKEPLTFDLDDYEELQQYELLKEVLKND